MATQTTRGGVFRFWRQKPAKPNARGNAVAFKAGAKAFKKSKGSSPDLQKVMLLALENEARSQG